MSDSFESRQLHSVAGETQFVPKTPSEYLSLFQVGRGQSGVQKAIREFQSNASNYEATRSYAFVGRTKIDGKWCDMLWFNHNGIEWLSVPEIIEAMFPSNCGHKEGAFAGMGLGSAAFLNCSLIEEPMLAVGGWINDKFEMVKVYQKPGTIELKREPAPELAAEYTRLVGETTLSKVSTNGRKEFNVVYGVKLQGLSLRANGTPDLPLKQEYMTALPFYASNLFGGAGEPGHPQFYYSQSQIGFEYPKPDERAKKASLEATDYGRSSSYFRKIYSRQLFNQLSCIKTYKISVDLITSPEDNVEVPVEAEVVLGFYQNLKRRPVKKEEWEIVSESGGSYCCNIRDFEEFERGKENEGVTPPNLKAYMVMSSLYNEAVEKFKAGKLSEADSKSWKRYDDNALLTHQHHNVLASLLGLSIPQNENLRPAMDLSRFDPTLKPFTGVQEIYNNRTRQMERYSFLQQPYITIEVNIKKIGVGRNMKTNEPLEYPSIVFAGQYNRTSDFWLGNKAKSQELMKDIIKIAATKIDPEAIELSNILFPIDENSRCRIRLGTGNGELESKKRKDGLREAKCHIWHLDGDELDEGKVEMDPNSRFTVVVQDIETKRLIKASELKIPLRKGGTPITRGIEFIDTTKEPHSWGSPSQVDSVRKNINELAELLEIPVKSIPVITITAEQTKFNGQNIPLEDYKPGKRGYSPSRSIAVFWKYS